MVTVVSRLKRLEKSQSAGVERVTVCLWKVFEKFWGGEGDSPIMQRFEKSETAGVERVTVAFCKDLKKKIQGGESDSPILKNLSEITGQGAEGSKGNCEDLRMPRLFRHDP